MSNISVVKIIRKKDENLILGMSHFIKTIEDIHEVLVNNVPEIKFGLAFCEASGPQKIRFTGTDKEMENLAVLNMQNIKAGHTFIIFLKDSYPINVLNAVKMVPEVCKIFCATANPLEVIIYETDLGRGIMGVIDGTSTEKVENKEDIKQRKEFLRKIGYKL